MTHATVGSCRSCGATLRHTFVDLGMSPLANSYIAADQLNQPEPFYPLHAYVCAECLLVQLESIAKPEDIFSDYAYFSSYSDTWVEHARSYAESVVNRFGLNGQSRVVEIASNDGYLLQFFVEKGIPVLGIEPADNVAQAALEKGIPTLVRFFGEETARELSAHGKADLVIGNNVLAHVPDLNGFVRGLKILLQPDGVITLEFPHLMRLMQENQFDTIYHEHYSYFSLVSIQKLFSRHGLKVFDVDELTTHGGSLRIYVSHEDDRRKPVCESVRELLSTEGKAGLGNLEHYLAFNEQVQTTKRKLLEFLTRTKAKQKSVVGYGAPAKGNTLLNYCGVGTDLIRYTVDRSPHKQGHFLPGTHIPIYSPERLRQTMPDYVLILPWNLKEEVMDQMKEVRGWNGHFVVPIPEVRIY
jgi:SAM-dependent methyltransferase